MIFPLQQKPTKTSHTPFHSRSLVDPTTHAKETLMPVMDRKFIFLLLCCVPFQWKRGSSFVFPLKSTLSVTTSSTTLTLVDNPEVASRRDWLSISLVSLSFVPAANAAPTRQLEFCLVSVARVVYWAQSVAPRLQQSPEQQQQAYLKLDSEPRLV